MLLERLLEEPDPIGVNIIRPLQPFRICRACACTEMRACPGGCFWVSESLCSSCADQHGDLSERIENAWGRWMIAYQLTGVRP